MFACVQLLLSLALGLSIARAASIPGSVHRRTPAEQFTLYQEFNVSFPTQEGISVRAAYDDKATFDASVAAGGPGLTGGPREVPADWKLNLTGVDFDFTEDWVALYYRNFHSKLALEIDCTPNAEGWCDYVALLSNATATAGKGVSGIDIQLPLDFRVLVHTETRAAFSQPFSIWLQDAAMLVSFANKSAPQTLLLGLERAQVWLDPFNTSMELANVTAEISLRPGLDITWTGDAPAAPRLATAPTLPQISLAVNAISSGDAECKPSDDSKASVVHDSTIVRREEVHDLTLVQREVRVRAVDVFGASANGESARPVDGLVIVRPEQDGCFQLDDATGTLVPAGKGQVDGAQRLGAGIVASAAAALVLFFL